MTISDGVEYRRRASFLLATLGRRAERAWHSYLTERGVTTAQFTAMAALASGERTQAEVAVAIAVDPRNIGATVKQLAMAHNMGLNVNTQQVKKDILTEADDSWFFTMMKREEK